jgi:hypothetical protein
MRGDFTIVFTQHTRTDKHTYIHTTFTVDGIARVGERINPGGVIINKYTPANTIDTLVNPTNLSIDEYNTTPLVYKGPTHR